MEGGGPMKGFNNGFKFSNPITSTYHSRKNPRKETIKKEHHSTMNRCSSRNQ